MASNKVSFAILLPLVIFLLFFYYWPMTAIIKIALRSSMRSWINVFTKPLFMKFILFTFFQAIITVLFSIIFGVPSGYLLARWKPYLNKLLRSMLTVPFLFPPIAILLGMVNLFGKYGSLNILFNTKLDPYTVYGIIFAHTLYNISVIARISEASFINEPQAYHDIADTLGASFLYKFRTITLPYIKPALRSGSLLVFMYSFNSFAIVLVLGQVKLQTIEVMIYTQSKFMLDYSTSAILVLFQLLINIIIIIYYTFQKDYEFSDEDILPIETYPSDKQRITSTMAIISIIIITWAPIIVIFQKTIIEFKNTESAFKEQLFSGQYDRYLGTSSIRVIFNTLYFGIIVAALAIVFSLIILLSAYYSNKPKVHDKIITIMTILPMGTSAISLSLGILLTHGKTSIYNNIVWIYIVSAQLMAALPFASRAILSSWKRVPKDLLLVSETLGANTLMSFEKVVYPLIKSALLIAVIFSFAISIGEFGATYYLTRGEWITLSIAIYKMITSRSIILPYIYAMILILISLISFLLIEKLGNLEMKL